MDKPETLIEHLNERIAEDLYQQSWSVQTHYFQQPMLRQLAAEALQLRSQQQLKPARIGRGISLQQNLDIRQDEIHWLSGNSTVQRTYLGIMENLRQTLNRSLMLGLFDFETHYAVYEAGAFYKQHYDSFQGASNRIVSVVAYLNERWGESDGGELNIYAPDQKTVIQTVTPLAGTLVVFLSEKTLHEVAVTHQQRLSIAGWFKLSKT